MRRFAHTICCVLALGLWWAARGAVAQPSPPQSAALSSGACGYTIQGDETLAAIAANLDVSLDTLSAYSIGKDITDPAFVQGSRGQQLSIPCPGASNVQRFFPLRVAGCFFPVTVPNASEATDGRAKQPTLLTLKIHPPDDQPGPFSLQGIWTANLQGLGLDLTAPGVLRPGREIYLPTCGHSGELGNDIVLHKTTTGCTFTPGGSSGGTGVTLQQLASTLSTDVGTLQRLNGDRNLTGSSVVTGRISIPCAPSP